MNWVIVGTLAGVVLVIGFLVPGETAGLVVLFGLAALAVAAGRRRRQRSPNRLSRF